jgi:hypothetical protein
VKGWGVEMGIDKGEGVEGEDPTLSLALSRPSSQTSNDNHHSYKNTSVKKSTKQTKTEI